MTLAGPEDAEALGAALAAALGPGDVVCLHGPLGAGKTTLARGAIRAWTGDAQAEAPSPTFTLVQAYDGPRGALWHMDLYRLKSPEEALELGVEDAFASALCLVEWADRLGPLTPHDRLDICLAEVGAAREARIEGHGRTGARWREAQG